MKKEIVFIVIICTFLIGLYLGLEVRNLEQTKINNSTLDSLNKEIESSKKKLNILNKTIHWKQLELMDLNNEKRK